jgi:hypothetical protein
MINIPEILSGPFTLDAVKLLLELHSTGLTQKPHLGHLAIFEHTLCSAEDCGVESTGLTKMAMIGRWNIITLIDQKVLLKSMLDAEDAEAFAIIFGQDLYSFAEKIMDKTKLGPTVSLYSGWTPVGDVAANVIGGAMGLAGVQIYDPKIHGQEIVEIDSVN